MHSVIGDTVSLASTSASPLMTDHGEARDYVEGMWLMLQQDNPEDFVLATGETHPVREFVEKSFNAVGIQLKCVD
jgi:GDP-D-mannose dehydratase